MTTPCPLPADQPRVRIRMDLAYDGTDFSGWAAQPGLRTVEGEVSAALGTILRSDPVRLTVGGRTDAGVHARGSVAHVDVNRAAWAGLPGRSDRPPQEAAVTRLAGVLPADIVVRAVTPVSDDFDARFSALQRRYTYRICDRPATLDPLRRRDTVLHKKPLDAEAMDEAARKLTGLHDFAAFCKKRDGATTVRTLLDYSWERGEDGILTGTVVADAFCHSMVRALVGSVVPVGEGEYAVGWPREILTTGVRDPRVTVMPAKGLCLEEITYPPDEALADRAEQARATRRLP
ncbi:tRNA pseudouridine(38-40) synthase TruA [Ornithinimicrobium cryptoxanthini]|uniref:tRNA pseudouridine synthase A n=1 Tax=Ornithinimicrobium cryptoxanthini TaxID=2934161 RepID=A0ABY4YL28_9MICO|nr:tRNA pseudouridine(38-40) synthase TruA [Ornithinimicrobium cryptoxanthini]USQ77043.1 tRNA pseudouridine(38-40) synthase TruA [Ornithinimicrobium cryptoxanthini]